MLRSIVSLRTRLIVAFAAVIALSLLLASGATVLLVREYQSGREKARLDDIARTISLQVRLAARSDAAQSEFESQLDQYAESVNVRVLLLSERGVILHDSEGNQLVDERLPIPANARLRTQSFQGTIHLPEGEQFYAVLGPALTGGPYRVAVLAPENSLTSAWYELLPRLSLAAIGSLLVSILIASWLASSITRPIVRITRASEEMAKGNLEQELALPESHDEIGRLSRAFTTMAREVSRSHRAMRDLLANVSHDLRTPLTSIRGFAGAIEDGTIAGGEGAQDAARIIGEEAERMSRLIEDLLFLGRIEAGDAAMEREPVDLSELALAAQRRFSIRAEERGVAMLTATSHGIMVRGDAYRLSRVLDNLLDNALTHTPRDGTVTISVSLEESSRVPGRVPVAPYATMRVHNTGSEIPPEELERIFERFYQVDKARADRNGRGLGLAIAREIVQALGGTIRVQSGAGEGTTFLVRLPAIEAPREAKLSSSQPAARSSRNPRDAAVRG